MEIAQTIRHAQRSRRDRLRGCVNRRSLYRDVLKPALDQLRRHAAGAGGRTRTGTGSLPRDFKSLVKSQKYPPIGPNLNFLKFMCKILCKLALNTARKPASRRDLRPTHQRPNSLAEAQLLPLGTRAPPVSGTRNQRKQRPHPCASALCNLQSSRITYCPLLF